MKPPLPCLWNDQAPDLAVVLAEDVIEEHEPRSLRVGPDLRPDDARRGEVALDDVRLEVVVEEVGGRAGQQPDRVVERPCGRRPETVRPSAARAMSSSGSSLKMSGGTSSRSGLMSWMTFSTSWLKASYASASWREWRAISRVVLAVVLAEEEVVAVLLGAERRRHEDRHEAVLHEVEVLDDVRPQQAQGVRERREPEARPELLGDGRSADEMAALEDEGPQTGLRQVGAVGQPVVAAADDDGVVGPVGRAAPSGGGGRRGRGLRRGLGVLRHVRRSFARD